MFQDVARFTLYIVPKVNTIQPFVPLVTTGVSLASYRIETVGLPLGS